MLFLVIEQFRQSPPRQIRDRFREQGRLLPAGVTYHGSWIDPARGRCFQIMEAPDEGALLGWAQRWADLVEFEFVPVETSSEYWARFQEG